MQRLNSVLRSAGLGVSSPLTPYRGESGGELEQTAGLPSPPNDGGELANSTQSVSYTVRRHFSSPVKFSSPVIRTTTHVRRTEKQTISRARAGYDRANWKRRE